MTGRWPANVILSPGMAEVLDGQSGPTGAHGRNRGQDGERGTTINFAHPRGTTDRDDSGGASRFFLTTGYEPWELEWIIANGLTPCGT